MPIPNAQAPMPGAEAQGNSGFAALLWQHKGRIAVITGLCAFLALVGVHMLPQRYAGEVQVLLPALAGQPLEITSSTPTRGAAQMQAVFRTRELAMQVITALKLAKKAEFDPLANGSGFMRLVWQVLGQTPDAQRMPQETRVLESYFARLHIDAHPSSGLVKLRFEAEDPVLAADIANKIVEIALSGQVPAGDAGSRKAADGTPAGLAPLLDKTIALMAQKHSEAQAKREAFRLARGIRPGDMPAMAQPRLIAEGEARLADIKAQQGELQARLKALRQGGDRGALSGDEPLRRLIEQQQAFRARIAVEEKVLLPNHPRMKGLLGQLQELEAQIKPAVERAAQALEAEARALKVQEEGVSAALARHKKAPALTPEDARTYAALEDEVALAQAQLEAYRTPSPEQVATTASIPAMPAMQGRVIAEAMPSSTPVFPKKLPIILAASLFGVLFASAVTLIPAFAQAHHVATRDESRPSSQKTIAEALGVAPVAEPFSGSPPPQAVPPTPVLALPSLKAADVIARELSLIPYRGSGKVLMVFGLDAEARTALYAMRVGRRLARDGASIVLGLAHEGDLYARVVGADAPGLSDYAAGRAAMVDIINRDHRSKLHVIAPGAPEGYSPPGAGMRDALLGMIKALAQSYMHVVVDAGPVGAAGDMLASRADAFILVCEADEDPDFITRTERRLQGHNQSPVFAVQDVPAMTPANDSAAIMENHEATPATIREKLQRMLG